VLDHADVQRVAKKAQANFVTLLSSFLDAHTESLGGGS